MDRGTVYGNWRAQVVDNKDTQKFGRVLVWIPDLMPEVSKREGIWARPANNPLGGRNIEADSDLHYMGSSLIPKKGSWVFVFFEGGNINLPYYFGALDLENTPVLPENQVGSNYEHKWTLIKSHEGRAFVVSDDPDDARVEITGMKRQMTEPPTGDKESVYQIDDNMTTILLDERDGKQKILIRTHWGDYLHIDVDERNLQAYFENDIKMECGGDYYLTVGGDINIKSKSGDTYIEGEGGKLDVKMSGDVKTSSGGEIHRKASGTIYDDGSNLIQQNGLAQDASSATDAEPEGERDT